MADKDTLLSILMSLNMCGHKSAQFKRLSDYFLEHSESLTADEIALLEVSGI
jgi:hypothetical protein